MIQIQYGDRVYVIEPMTIAIYTLATTCLIAGMFQDGWSPIMFALGLIIFDALRFPYPAVTDVTDELEEVDDDDDFGIS